MIVINSYIMKVVSTTVFILVELKINKLFNELIANCDFPLERDKFDLVTILKNLFHLVQFFSPSQQ